MAIALVQHSSADKGSVASPTTLAFSSNVTAGSLLVCLVRTGDSSSFGVPTVSDNNGNTWQAAKNTNDGTGMNCAIWYAMNANAGATTVSVSWPSGTITIRLAIGEYSGVATASALDAFTSTTGTSASLASGSITPAQNNELVVGLEATENGNTYTQTGTVSTVEESQPASPKIVYVDLVQTTATAATVAATITSDTWVGIIASFKAAAAVAALAPLVDPAVLILHQFGFDNAFVLPPLTISEIDANVTAGQASVTVSAFAPSVSITGLPGAPNVTVAGLAVTNPQVGAQPDTPNVAVAAYQASVNISGNANANAGNANVNVTGLDATNPQVIALPDTPNVTIGANNPGVVTGLPVLGAPFPFIYLIGTYGTGIFLTPLSQTGTNDTALPPVAQTVSVAALAPAVLTVTVLPSAATVTVSTPTVTQQITGLPDTPNVTVAAPAPLPVVTALPSVANVVVAALNPSVTTSGGTTALPSVANVTVAALNPSIRTDAAPTAGIANITVAALNPVATVNPTAVVAAVVIAALTAQPLITVGPGAANVMPGGTVPNVSGTGAHLGSLTARTSAVNTLTAGTAGTFQADDIVVT